MTDMANSEKANELLKQLQDGVEKLVTGEDWKRALAFQARFHQYSWNNTFLIALQRPDATYVRGFKQWLEMGRHVRKGEHGIAILAPNTRKVTDEDTGEVRHVVTGFRTAFVFDVAQTDGDPLPIDVLHPEELDGDAPAELRDAFVEQASSLGYTVDFDLTTDGSLKGVTLPGEKRIRVKKDVSPLQAVKTLVHELAHTYLHVGTDYDYAGHRGIAETEAESIAFVVCAALGLPTDDYSFAYIGGWSKGDMNLVKDTAARVAQTARTILKKVEVKEVAA
jgi:antirestriction protein ArdC